MKNKKLWYQSSYDRGLEHLLRMWPDIKKAVPEAELGIAYGWVTFDSAFKTNPERMNWKSQIEEMMNQADIVHYGRLGQEELRVTRSKHGIWAYPTHFEEINCIGALESQKDGLVPVVINYAALVETVGSGVKIDGDIFLKETRKKYFDALIDMMTDEKKWAEESKKAIEFAKSYSWDLIADKWEENFK
jgi:glycosyltransferase involved in cell wall biosynthesis